MQNKNISSSKEFQKQLTFGHKEKISDDIVKNFSFGTEEQNDKKEEMINFEMENLIDNIDIFLRNSLRDIKTNLETRKQTFHYILYLIGKFAINQNEDLVNKWLEYKFFNLQKKKKRMTLSIPHNRRKTDLVIELDEVPDLEENEYSLQQSDTQGNIFKIENKTEKKKFGQEERNKTFLNEKFEPESLNLEKKINDENNSSIEELDIKQIRTIRKSINDINIKKVNNNNKRVSEVFSALDKIKREDFLIDNLGYFKLRKFIKKASKIQVDLETGKIETKKLFKKKINFYNRRKTSFLKIPVLILESVEEKKNVYNQNVFKEDIGDVTENTQEISSFINQSAPKNSFKVLTLFENHSKIYKNNNSINDKDFLTKRIFIKDFARLNYTKNLDISKNLGVN
jgi:hypothetical protein